MVSQRIKLTRHLNLAKVTLGQAVVQPHPALQDLLRFNDMESDTAEGDPLSSIEEDESSEEGSEIVESGFDSPVCAGCSSWQEKGEEESSVSVITPLLSGPSPDMPPSYSRVGVSPPPYHQLDQLLTTARETQIL